jgi:hypothetical protein
MDATVKPIGIAENCSCIFRTTHIHVGRIRRVSKAHTANTYATLYMQAAISTSFGSLTNIPFADQI